jgi:hypothetical protein
MVPVQIRLTNSIFDNRRLDMQAEMTRRTVAVNKVAAEREALRRTSESLRADPKKSLALLVKSGILNEDRTLAEMYR